MNNDNQQQPQEQQQAAPADGEYVGVRRRDWGRWVAEIHEPGHQTRMWLGTFDTPEMAAVAHDVAAFHLKGTKEGLNFPDWVDDFPKPVSRQYHHIRVAAQKAAMWFSNDPELPEPVIDGGTGASVMEEEPVQVELSDSETEEEINETPLDSSEMPTEKVKCSEYAFADHSGCGCHAQE